MLLLTLLFSLLAFIGSVIHSAIAVDTDEFVHVLLDLIEPDSLQRVKALLSQTPEGKLYYPYWPLFPLQMAIVTPVVVVVSTSLSAILFCLHALIGFRDAADEHVTDIKELKVGSTRDLVYAYAGTVLILLGAAVYVSIYAIRCINGRTTYWQVIYDMFLVYFFFTFAGQACLLCSSKSRGKAARVLLFLLSIAVFVSSIFLLANQVSFMDAIKSSDGSYYPCSPVNATTGEFCVWHSTDLPSTANPNNVEFKSNANRPSRQQRCIPLSQKCDGVLDMFPDDIFNCDFSSHGLYYSLRYFGDESACGSTRYIWLVIFNLASGAVAIPISVVIFFKTVKDFAETVKLVGGLFLWLYNSLRTAEQASDVESIVTSVEDFNQT